MVGRTKKTTIAREQLEDGLLLLMQGRSISALTLLGAAEEVLARLLEESGGIHFLDDMWQGINDWNREQGGSDVPKRTVYRNFNEPRNSVKHHTPGEKAEVVIFKEAAALMMARRALYAADQLKLKCKHRKSYADWVKGNGND